VCGNSVFRKAGAEIVGHKKIHHTKEELQELIRWGNEELRKSGYEKRAANNEAALFLGDIDVTNPNIRIEKDTELEVAGEKIQILTTTGHTETNLSVFFPEEEVACVGDLICSRFLPTLMFGNKMLWSQWIESLEKIEKLAPKIVVPGH